ncbi:MAG: ATP-binding protein [Elusimicrobia bacterium]|nr:ATP-binding protein [Elusimicrobiota bacterium]
MNYFIPVLVLGAVLGFAVYWYIKFRFLLPVESRLKGYERAFSGFMAFSKEILDHTYIPDSLEHYGDITNYYLIKLHKLFPDSSMLVFEKEEGGWKLINYLKNFKVEPKLMSSCNWAALDSSARHGETIRLDSISGAGSSAELLAVFDIQAAVICPFMPSAPEGYQRLLVFGARTPADFELAETHLQFIALQLNSVFKIKERVFALKKETDHLKAELNAVVRELDMAGSRLIQRAKERKALYEVVTKVTGSEKDAQVGCSAILNIVAKIVEADVVACLLFDEAAGELSVGPGPYGILDAERAFYSIPVSNNASASVRTFLTRKPFISPDAQNDPEVLSTYSKRSNIHSLMLVPISTGDRVIGVLRVGSRKINYFTQDNLEFLTIIADELAIIIEMVTLYDNISRKAEELAQLNRLKDEFLSTVSHELKTPLTTIKGFVSVILSGEVGPLNEQQSNFLNIADQSVNRLTHLISNLLDISRLNSKVEMEFQPVILGELIRTSVSNMMLKARESGVTLASSVDDALPAVHGDPRWIIQVIDNLILNAIKYSGKGSNIMVTGRDKSGAAVIGVEDNGPGIPEAEQKLIFEKFYRGKTRANQVPGTGLGLAISKSIIEKHGGKIWLESKPGQGAKFFFALPADTRDVRDEG